MKNKFNIYTKNHKSLIGITDIINMFKFALNLNKFEYTIESKFNLEANNIVIDEFTSYFENRKFRKFKSNDKSLNLLVTEFINCTNVKFFGRIIKLYYFNNFDIDNKKIVWLYLLAKLDFELNKYFIGLCISHVIKIPFYLLLKIINLAGILVSPIRSPNFIIYGVLRIILRGRINYLKNTFFYRIYLLLTKKYSSSDPSFTSKIITKISKVNNSIYNIKRFMGLNLYINKFNKVFFIHPKQIDEYKKIFKNTKFLTYFLPSFNDSSFYENFKHRNFGFYFSGRLTTDRRSKCNLFINDVSFYIKKQIPLKLYDFSTVKKSGSIEKFKFSLHPPQDTSWPFSSPTRIYISFYNDFSIPVIFKKFGDCEIEEIALNYDDKNDFLTAIDKFSNNFIDNNSFKNKISSYLKIANINNSKVLRKIINDS